MGDMEPGNNKNNNGSLFKNKKFLAIMAVVIVIFGFLVYRGAQSGDSEESVNEPGSSRVEGSNQGINISESVGETHTGAEDANNNNGTGAILAFDYAYYNDRDGEKVLQYFDPNNQDYDADYVQRYIDRTSSSTEYELAITPQDLGERYHVVLTLTLPGYEPVQYSQDVLTVERDGKYYVQELSSRLMSSDN